MHDILQIFVGNGLELVPMKKGTKIPLRSWNEQLTFNSSEFEGNDIAIKLNEKWAVLDIEGPKKSVNGLDYFVTMIQSQMEFPDTLSWSTPSGGLAFLFRVTKPFSAINRAHDIGVELRTGKAIHKVPPSVNYEFIDEDAEIAECPAWLIELLQTKQQISVNHITRSGFAYSRHDVESALEILTEQDNYDLWIRVGLALKTAPFDAFDLWENWSRKSPKAENVNFKKRWESFKPHLINLDWLISYAHRIHCNNNPVSLPCDQAAQVETETKESIADEILKIMPFDGIMSDVYKFIYGYYEQHQFALGGALFVLTAALQRRVRYPKALQNGYHCFIGGPSSRKTRTCELVQLLLAEADLCKEMPEPRSIGAFKKELSEDPSQYIFFDEWGRTLLQNVYVRNPVAQSAEQTQMLLKLFAAQASLAGHATMKHETTVNKIINPRLSVLSTGTTKDFVELARKPEFLTSGMASRLCVWFATPAPYKQYSLRAGWPSSPPELIATLEQLKRYTGDFVISDEVDAYIGYQDEYKWQPFMKSIDESLESIKNRMIDYGGQFSCLAAISEGVFEVQMKHIEWGDSLAFALFKQMTEQFELGREDPVEHAVNEAIEYLSKKKIAPWQYVYKSRKSLRHADAAFRETVLRHLKSTGRVTVCPSSKQLIFLR